MPVIDIEALLEDYQSDPKQHALLLHLNFPLGKLATKRALAAVFDLEDVLREVIEKTGVGNFDGNEFAEGDDEESVTFFMYGPDADAIHEVIAPLISYMPVMPGSYIFKRYGGDPDAREKQLFLA